MCLSSGCREEDAWWGEEEKQEEGKEHWCQQWVLWINTFAKITEQLKQILSNTMHPSVSFPANKSLVSSSMGSECTFFQTLDDHITQPVLFIPETHLSSLQRMVCLPFNVQAHVLAPFHPFFLFSHSKWIMFPTLASLQATGQARESQGKNCGKECSGKNGLGGDCVSESDVRHWLEIMWVNWSRNQAQEQVLTLRLSYGGLHENTHTWCNSTQTPDTQYAPPSYSLFPSLTHTLRKTVRRVCCSDRPVFPHYEV